MPRYQTLTKLAQQKQKKPSIDNLRKMLASHQGTPTPPCRHANTKVNPPVTGMTLATVRFDVANGNSTLVHGQPCSNKVSRWLKA